MSTRAHNRLGERSYNLLFNNCEHFVMWCIKDQHHSPQVTEAAATLLAAQVARSSLGHLTSVATAGVTGASLSSSVASGATTAALTSLVGVSIAPAWAPLAVGAAAAYGAHKLWNWLTD